jgi:hypothetical protein
VIRLKGRSATALVITIVLSVAVSCSSNDDGKIEASPVVSIPTPQSTQTVDSATGTPITPEPTPLPESTPSTSTTPATSVAISPPTELPIEIDFLTVPICRTTNADSNGEGFGTVPHATPTAIPAPGSSGGSHSAETAEFVTGLNPLMEAILAVTAAADQSWSDATNREDMARVVLYEGRRLSHLCSALSVVPLTTDGKAFIDTMAVGLIARRELLSATAELARDGSVNRRSLDSDRTGSSTNIAAINLELREIAIQAGLTSVESAPFTIVNPLLSLRFGATAGWLVVRNGIDIVLLAPSEQQVYSVRGLGPDAWKLGTALRVRRFRSSEPAVLSDTAGNLDALYTQYGERSDSNTADFESVDGLMHVYRDVDRHWNTLVAIAVVDRSTYLFELGCPDEIGATCISTLQRFVASVVFTDR